MEKFVLSLDVGTTTIRAFVYNQQGAVCGQDTDKVNLLNPKPGYVEIDPEELWTSVLKVMKNALQNAHIDAHMVTCAGISTQRATFITWNSNTGKPYHNFVTWKDLRADSLVKEWDSSFTMKAIRFASRILHMVTRHKKFMVGSIVKLKNNMVNMRLLWCLQNIPELIAVMKNPETRKEVKFGTVESWLLYKLSGDKKLHVSTTSNAAATGLYDPFSLDWALWAFEAFAMPKDIVPMVVNDAGDHLGCIAKEHLGADIPIRCVMADQSASIFGLGCFLPGQMKMSLGSGSFLDVNTGKDIHASMKGLVPLVGWRIGEDLVYLAEGALHDTSSLILWSQSMGLFHYPSESSDLAECAPDSDLFFIPGFGGLQAPINDPNATAGFIGLTPATTSKELLRAVLESIAFGMKQLLEVMETESPHSMTSDSIMIDGGVANNDFIAQLIATLTGRTIERFGDTETSAFGVAFVAGLQAGIWTSKTKDISMLRKVAKVFQPDCSQTESRLQKYKKWTEACHRFKNWHAQ